LDKRLKLNNQQKNTSTARQAQVLRIFRKTHRITAIYLFSVFLVISVTGLLLGWKEHSNGYILPESTAGSNTELSEWLPVDVLQNSALEALDNFSDGKLSKEISRIDIRPAKGIVKFVFKHHYWEVQLDGATAEVLQVAKRRSDLIENIHDGSVIDQVFGTRNKAFKLIYTTVSGLALLLFTVTGFWLWFGSKMLRKTVVRNKK
jgi:hypothetical protein